MRKQDWLTYWEGRIVGESPVTNNRPRWLRASRLPPANTRRWEVVTGDPKQWRLEAARCLLVAAEAATSLETREELIALAHMWLKRAAKLESDLLEQQKNVPDEVQKLSVEGSDISVLPSLAD